MAGILHMMNAPIGGSSGLSLLVDAVNVNVANMLIANGWDGVSIVNPIVTIEAGARIYSASTSIPALTTGALPSGSTVTIINNGLILGRGGDGGKGGDLIPGGGAGSGQGSPGGNGGTALQITVPATVTNNGAIAGGGGGGGGGALIGGGGGGGAGGSIGGGYGFSYSGGYGGAFGAGGTLEYAGYGGNFYPPGGNGGTYGNPGSAGASSGGDSGGAGGAAGLAVSGDSLVTWVLLGTIYGARVG